MYSPITYKKQISAEGISKGTYESKLQKIYWGLIGTFILPVCTNVSLWSYFILFNSIAAFLAYIFPIEF